MKKTLLSALIAASIAVPAFAYEKGDLLVRAGATNVSPESDKAGVFLDGAYSGLDVSVEDDTQLGLNLVYFYDKNWAVELLAATPFQHDVTLHAGNDKSTLAEVTHLPPTLSALYYFDVNEKFNPYVGLGINYTVFFDEEFKSAYKEAGFSDLSLDNSFGFAAQVGADYQLDDKWHVNASVRYIAIDTTAEFSVADTVSGKADIDINPFVYTVSVGYKF